MTTVRRCDVIVIGLGAMGLATCWRLAQRGAQVVGLEQFRLFHDHGSSHGHSRLIRLAYYEHPDYVPLLKRAYELWDELAAAANVELLIRAGGLYLGPGDSELIVGAQRASQQHRLAHELLSAAAVRERFPQFTPPDGWLGFYEPEAGALLVEPALSALASCAIGSGAELRAHEPVEAWRSTGDQLVVRTTHGEYHAKHLVLTAGPWTATLLAPVARWLTVTRQSVVWTQPLDTDAARLGQMPCWAAAEADGLSYGFPLLPGHPGLKSAWHGYGPIVDPERVDRTSGPDDERRVRAALAALLPLANGNTLGRAVCLYTMSPDGHFILDHGGRAALPLPESISLACGFSGHGFKFASVVGEVLSDWALDGHTALPVEFLSLVRLATR